MHDSHPPEPQASRHLAIGHLGLAGLVAQLAGGLDQQEDAAHARDGRTTARHRRC